MRRRGNVGRRLGVTPAADITAAATRDDRPCGRALPIGSSSLPVGPGTLTSPRISGSLLVWQDTSGVFGVDLSTGKPLAIPSSGTSEPDVSGSLVVWKQGPSAINGLDTSTGAQFSVPVGNAKVFGPSVSDAGVVAWLAQDANGVAVLAWDRATNATSEAGRIPTARLSQEVLGPPRVSGRQVMFPDLTTDPASRSRMILFNLDCGQRLPFNDSFSWQAGLRLRAEPARPRAGRRASRCSISARMRWRRSPPISRRGSR